MKFNYNNIPEEFQHRLQYLGDLGEEKSWGIGRLSVLLWRSILMLQEDTRPSKMQYYKAVGYWCKTPSETVRMYHHVVDHVPDDVVREYEDTAKEPTFHMYKAMIPHCTEPIDYVNYIEAWGQDRAEQGYSFVDVEGFRGWLSAKNGAPPAWQGRLRRAQRLCEQLFDDPDCPKPIKSYAFAFKHSTIDYLDHPPLP